MICTWFLTSQAGGQRITVQTKRQVHRWNLSLLGHTCQSPATTCPARFVQHIPVASRPPNVYELFALKSQNKRLPRAREQEKLVGISAVHRLDTRPTRVLCAMVPKNMSWCHVGCGGTTPYSTPPVLSPNTCPPFACSRTNPAL
eukprot:1148672-Pelagomonas_calceolata.AAC.4